MKDSPKKKKKKLVKHKSVAPKQKEQLIPPKNDIWYILPLVSLFIVLLVLTVYNLSLKEQIVSTTLQSAPKIEVADFPLVKNSYALDLSAESAIIVDDSSKVVLFEKKPMLRFSMASTTKIMTALVGLEHFKKNDVITIYTPTVEGATVEFIQGDTFYFEDMLYAMMLPSANNAAYAIAENYPGGMPAFVARMNEKAQELQLTYTDYADPAGLDDDGNYSTVVDLSRLASYALTNQDIAGIVSTKRKVITNIAGTHSYTLTNLNKLLGQNGVTGVKTGFTEGAGEVLITSKLEKGRTFIIVVMRSEDRFGDTERLLSYISDNVSFINPLQGTLNEK